MYLFQSGNEDRGYILGPVDELNQVLEDNMINLQSMSASQFIGPFLSTVQKWEKAMQTISEVVEAWIELQKKWMYLEGIFIGGDIRSQLPEEARKFDDVDNIFRKTMMDTSRRLNVLECCSMPGTLKLKSIWKNQVLIFPFLQAAKMNFKVSLLVWIDVKNP